MGINLFVFCGRVTCRSRNSSTASGSGSGSRNIGRVLRFPRSPRLLPSSACKCVCIGVVQRDHLGWIAAAS
jgi:hypothetical protein